ncbi:hypothetical protein VSVS05_01136 [Vibrio scophthalmi]|uniref:DksA C4-type domain-containing protein n=1 Tax=Vibrio scophthalmi TaxID=45658 RepID=A0A1C7FA18_9VIBR|nr:hypothetical protein VSVS05_01136 [Vibrio scophthalmi]
MLTRTFYICRQCHCEVDSLLMETNKKGLDVCFTCLLLGEVS